MMRIIEHFSVFFGDYRAFWWEKCRKNGALRWSTLVGKQKHNVQRPKKGLTGYCVI